jgi:hypothetical protein
MVNRTPRRSNTKEETSEKPINECTFQGILSNSQFSTNTRPYWSGMLRVKPVGSIKYPVVVFLAAWGDTANDLSEIRDGEVLCVSGNLYTQKKDDKYVTRVIVTNIYEEER